MSRKTSALAKTSPETDSPLTEQSAKIKLEPSKHCSPFLKWAGGKSQLLPEIISRLPAKFESYFEPMVGGGAVFFALHRSGRIDLGKITPGQCYIADTTPELINCYRVVRDKLPQLIEDLNTHLHDKDYFYQLRQTDRSPEQWSELTEIQRASRFIYLNKTCYNGLYRVNSKGEFNVPFGKYKNPRIFNSEQLHACSKLLQNTEIALASFETTAALVQRGDFVYFDPPYDPLSETALFTAYSKEGFSRSSQRLLRDTCREIDAKGGYFLLSNSFTTFILDLYRDFRIHTVAATRAINSKAENRGSIREVLISNY